MMRVEVVRGPLAASLVGRWIDITNSNPSLGSPFFRPEFTQAVATCRTDVHVASINDGEAFLPFQPRRFGFAQPVGSPLSDYHGLVSEPREALDLPEILRRCNLRAWSFNHVPTAQTGFVPWSVRAADSPILNLAQDAPSLSKDAVAQFSRKRRKAERELGAVEFEMACSDPVMLDWCLTQKSCHYKLNNSPDIFKWGWPRRLVEAIFSCRDTPDFCGMLSVLRVGGNVVAAHFGMRSRHIMHWWFPTYDLKYSHYSPGMLLLLEVISAAPSFGISVIDFGKGDRRYKQQFSNDAVPLVEGCVTRERWVSAVYRQRSRILRLAHRRIATESNPLYRTVRKAYWAVRF